jgi:formate dehydrogenase major subunit
VGGYFANNKLEDWKASDAPMPQDQNNFAGFIKRHVGRLPNPLSKRSLNLEPRIKSAQKHVSVCPYCAVGCSQSVFVKDGKITNIEGNAESPVNRGTLCPKGSATYGLVVNPLRLTKVKYRAPYATEWEEKPLDWAMERIAQLVKQTRDETHIEYSPTNPALKVNRTPGIAHIGGATLDNEENYLIIKLFRSLGLVYIENQARI